MVFLNGNFSYCLFPCCLLKVVVFCMGKFKSTAKLMERIIVFLLFDSRIFSQIYLYLFIKESFWIDLSIDIFFYDSAQNTYAIESKKKK